MRALRRFAPMVVAALVAGAGWWLSSRLAPVSTTEPVKVGTQADFRVEGLEAIATTPLGKKQYLLKAEVMTQFPGQRGAELLAPDLTQYDDSGAPTRTTARRGQLSADKTLLTMTGNVRMFKPRQGKQGEALLETEQLTVKLAP